VPSAVILPKIDVPGGTKHPRKFENMCLAFGGSAC
jgi:hypothetical protein